MKVKELIKLLQERDQNALVVLAKDAEGNAFRPLDTWGPGHYDKSSGELTDGKNNAVVLWPED